MAATVRERIIQAIVNRLAQVREVYGFPNDAGLNVHREKRQLVVADLPALNVWPGEESSSREYQKQVCLLNLQIDLQAVIGAASASARKQELLAALIIIMTDPAGRSALDPDGLINDIEYTGGGTSATVEAGETTVGIAVTFRIKYRFKTGDPYTP